MAKINDRRSSKDGDPVPDADAVKHGAVIGAIDVEKAAGVTRHKDGSIRRITPGIRSLGDFLDAEQADKMLTRGDSVNVFASLWFQERESRWYRCVWRWLTHQPQVRSVLTQLAHAHARGLEEVKRQMQEQVDQAAKSAAAFKAGAGVK